MAYVPILYPSWVNNGIDCPQIVVNVAQHQALGPDWVQGPQVSAQLSSEAAYGPQTAQQSAGSLASQGPRAFNLHGLSVEQFNRQFGGLSPKAMAAIAARYFITHGAP